MKCKMIWASILWFIAFVAYHSSCAQERDGIPHGLVEAVEDFYDEATLHSAAVRPLEISIRVAPLLDNNGIVLVNNGHADIVIDSDFYNYFHNKSQLRRLIFNLMAQALIDANKQGGNSIMNDSQVYRKLKPKMVTKLFKTYTLHAPNQQV